jgi:hypothetical protein
MPGRLAKALPASTLRAKAVLGTLEDHIACVPRHIRQGPDLDRIVLEDDGVKDRRCPVQGLARTGEIAAVRQGMRLVDVDTLWRNAQAR